MKLYDLGAVALLAFLTAIVAQGAQQPAAACETVDMGGYLNYADPTCPAWEAGSDEPVSEDTAPDA